MLEIFYKAVVETLVEMVAEVLIAYFKLENAVEIATALFGLTCIAVGAAAAWYGWL